MSLPIGSSGAKPTRPATHKVVDLTRLMNLGSSVDELAHDDQISAEALEDRAIEDGVSLAHLYIAAAVVSDVQVTREHDVAFEVCAGGCQGWGAAEVLEHLLEQRQDRIEAGTPTFDVVPRRCLDKCASAPAVIAVSPDGRAVIEAATVASLDEAIAELLET